MADRTDHRTATVGLNLGLWLLAGLVAVPFLWMVTASLSPDGAALRGPLRLLPTAPTLVQYRELFGRLNFGRSLANSLTVATLLTVSSLLVNSLAGYAFAKGRFRGRNVLFTILLAALVIPGQVTMLPVFLLLRTLGMLNSYAGLVIPAAASIFGIFLIRQYCLSIPDELLESARIDGASEWLIYRKIVLPLIRPALVTLGLFTFLGAWNDFLWPLVVLSDSQLYTLPVALANLLGENASRVELMMAGSVVVVAPVLVVFLALQRHYIGGIMNSGLKE